MIHIHRERQMLRMMSIKKSHNDLCPSTFFARTAFPMRQSRHLSSICFDLFQSLHLNRLLFQRQL
jgi:hypothetical protein